MDQYKYTIEMDYLDSATSTVTNIGSANIKSLIIDRDYDNYHMAMVFATLILDKNLIDDMIKKASLNSINMTIYKFINSQSEQIKTIYVRDKFTYFIYEDINYNKDIDYGDEVNKNRKDIYKSISVGLMSKASIDNNKKSFNSTITNTTMINAIGMCVKHMPILIEPLTYNKNIAQLIMPPTSSVWNALKFLNSVAVFYESPYRFFIDFDTTYLLSSNGVPTPKKGEKFSTVMINMRNTNDYAANTIGMSEDHTNSMYMIEINTADTKYSIDKQTEKSFNNISAVLDTSKEKSKTNVSSIQKGIDDAMRYIQTINSSVNGKIESLIGIHRSSIDINHSLNFNTNLMGKLNTILSGTLDNVKTALSDLPTGILEVENLHTNIIDTTIASTDMCNSMPYVANAYKSIHSALGGHVDSVVDTLSYVNGITAVNLKDNLPFMQKRAVGINIKTAATGLLVQQTTEPLSISMDTVKQNTKDLIDRIENLPSKVSTVVSNSGGDAVTPIDLSKVLIHLPALKDSYNNMNGVRDILNTNITTACKLPDLVGNVNSTLLPIINNMNNVSNSLPSSAMIANLRGLSSMIAVGTMGFNTNMISQIKANLDNIKDIADIGRSGTSKVDVKLNIGGDPKDPEKKKIVRVANDNVNIVKNIKAQVELDTTKLSLNKNDLDASVITINKEYIIKNFDGHSDKDGRFLLSRKRELFIRQDETFVMNTMMDFKRIKKAST